MDEHIPLTRNFQHITVHLHISCLALVSSPEMCSTPKFASIAADTKHTGTVSEWLVEAEERQRESCRSRHRCKQQEFITVHAPSWLSPTGTANARNQQAKGSRRSCGCR